MKRRSGPFEPEGLTIAYKELGTISIEELTHALIADMRALREIYNIQFLKNCRLRLYVTNEYGEEIKVRRPRRCSRA